MPVDYKLYSKKWKDIIRPDILRRADYKCENCGAQNYWYRITDGNGNELYLNEEDGAAMKKKNPLITKIVLTISHSDHNIENNDYSNLRALCQKCHLSYDQLHHIQNRKLNAGNKKTN